VFIQRFEACLGHLISLVGQVLELMGFIVSAQISCCGTGGCEWLGGGAENHLAAADELCRTCVQQLTGSKVLV
jgi:hypothetical protein